MFSKVTLISYDTVSPYQKKTQVFSHSRCLYRHFGEAIHLFCLQAADSWDPDQAAGLLP